MCFYEEGSKIWVLVIASQKVGSNVLYNEISHSNSLASFKYNKILRNKKKYKSWKREKIIKESTDI